MAVKRPYQRAVEKWSNNCHGAVKLWSNDFKELLKGSEITIKGQSNGVQMAISKVK